MNKLMNKRTMLIHKSNHKYYLKQKSGIPTHYTSLMRNTIITIQN